MLTISSDGYIRLSPAQLAQITLTHVLSGLDEDCPPGGAMGAVSTSITGYTEWGSHDQAVAITIGWDWQMNAADGALGLTMLFEPRSNVMLQDANAQDLGPDVTAAMLAAWVNTQAWQNEVAKQLQTRYALHG